MTTMSVEDIIELSRKDKYNWIMVIIVAVTWFRLLNYIFVIEALSILLNTLFSMAISGLNFTFILF